MTPGGRMLLRLLDGTRDQATLAEELDLDPEALAAALDELARRALLVA